MRFSVLRASRNHVCVEERAVRKHNDCISVARVIVYTNIYVPCNCTALENNPLKSRNVGLCYNADKGLGYEFDDRKMRVNTDIPFITFFVVLSSHVMVLRKEQLLEC